MTRPLLFALAFVAALGLSTPLAYAQPNAIGSFDADLSSRAASQAVGSCGTAGMLSYSACVANHLGGAGAPHINAYDERPYKPSIVQSALTGLPPGTASESSRDFIRDTALNEISSDPQLGSKSFVAVAETDPPQRIEAISDKEYRSIARVMDIRDYALSEMLERALKDTEYRKSNAKALRDKIEDTLSWIGKKKLAEHVQSGTFVTEAALLQFPYSVVGIITTSSSQDSKAVKADTARIAGRFKEIKALLADLYSSTGVDSIQETYYLALARAVMMEPIDEALGLLAPVTDVYMQRRFREGIRIVPLRVDPELIEKVREAEIERDKWIRILETLVRYNRDDINYFYPFDVLMSPTYDDSTAVTRGAENLKLLKMKIDAFQPNQFSKLFKADYNRAIEELTRLSKLLKVLRIEFSRQIRSEIHNYGIQMGGEIITFMDRLTIEALKMKGQGNPVAVFDKDIKINDDRGKWGSPWGSEWGSR